MRRLVSLAVLLFFAVPFGASVVGCGHKTVTVFCNGGDSGPVVGQVKSITLSPSFATFGESLNFGQIGSGLSASAVDCKGSSVSVRSYTYATSDKTFADINPASGQVCGGTFNINTGGGIPDYTICTAPVNPPATNKLTPLVAYITATADGAVSNAIPVYIHPIVTSIVIGNPTTQANCSTDPDPATNCCPISTGAIVTAPAYLGTSCLSQGVSAQLTARAYKNGTTNPADNITCQIGHLGYSAQNLSVLTIDENGVLTAAQPGSTIITASISNSGSGGAAGFFSTCPPASITLSAPGQANPTNITVGVNNSTPLVATVLDTNGVTLTGLNLEFNSTTPTTIPATVGAVTPTFPGSATITAVCQPATCNAAPFSQIGLFGNGKPITSNGVQVTAPGTNTTVLYIGSTQSQYLLPVDFSTGQQGSLLKLPYIPNSMVITQDGSTIYLGSGTALMTVSALTNSVTASNQAITGTVLSVSPDASTVVVTDPIRQTVSLVSGGTTVTSTYGGVGTRAQWSPDSQTVYVTANSSASGPQLLVHSQYTGWYATPTSSQYVDVAVMVPSIGAFFSTNTGVTEGRTYCSTSVPAATGNPPAVANTYYPVANDTTVQTDRIAATNDGNHILGATVSTTPASLNDIVLSLPATATQPGGPRACTTATATVTFNSTFSNHPLTGVAATSITGVFPASNSLLSFVTYTGTSGLLPEYIPATGTVSTVALSSGAVAPVAGVFSTDNKTFFTGTSGDNQVHLITITGTAATDSSVIAPKLPDGNGNIVVPNLLVQRPKKSTS
jgi:trimeric autotransporter adhesin